jgi:hypothetical protein
MTGSMPKKKKSALEPTGKKKTVPAKPALQKNIASKSAPAKPGPAQCRPSIKIEDVADENDVTHSERPCNP